MSAGGNLIGGEMAAAVAVAGSSERLSPFKVKQDLDASRKGLRPLQRSVYMQGPVDFAFLYSNYQP